ncbi:MAG: hypothetical protein ACI8PW_001690 [Methylophilaceae bacterium]|jgi:hypothetical protein
MSLCHSVVWFDHHEAHVIQFNTKASKSEIIKTKLKHKHVHHKSDAKGSGHSKTDQNYTLSD